MSNTLAIGKKAFTWTVVIATIAWAVSAALIVVPLTAKAATLTAGDLVIGTVKSSSGPGRPVYYYGSDGKRYLFPSSQTYKSWFGTDFSKVKQLTEAELQAVPFGKNVTAKGGTLVKFVGPDTNLYAVEKGGVRRKISDADAKTVYGDDYLTADLHSIPEAFQANYTAGSDTTATFSPSTAAAATPDIGTDLGLGATPVSTGPLTVALASDNPAGSGVPGGSSSVVLLKVNVTAGSTAQTVSGLTVRLQGVGAVADISSIYVYEGATRLTSGRTVGSQTRSTEFSGLSLAVGANATRTLSVVADISASQTAGDTHAVQLTSLATTASVSGLPLTGNTFSMGSQDVSTVQMTSGTAPANPTIGQQGVAISEFRLTAGTNDTEVRRVTVTVGGTVTVADVTAFALYQGGNKLADGVVNSDRVTFDLSSAPYTIAQGVQRIFTIKANVGGRGARTIITYIDSTYPTDLLAVDKVYGYGSTVNFGSDTTCDATEFCSSTTGVTVTTQGGKVTIAFNGPAASDVAVGTQDVPLLKFSMTAGDQAVEVRRLVASLDSTAAAGEMSDDDSGSQVNFFTDVKVKDADSGAVLMGPQEITATGDVTAAQTFTYTDSWNLESGKTRNLLITADIRNTSDTDLVGNGYQVTLTQFNATSIREVSTGQYLAITDIVPNPTAGIVGNTMTVRASSLTVQLASTPVSGTTVKGATGVSMAGFSFAAGVQSAVKVTQIVMTGQGDDTGGTYTAAEFDDVVISARLYDGDTAVSDSESPNTSGVITFDNMNWSIAAGATKKLSAKVSLSTTLMSSATDTAWLGINAAGDVTATDKDSNTVTATDGDSTWSSPINSTPTVLLTVQNSGQLTVDIDGDTPLSAIVVGGTSDVSAAKFKFIPAYESFLIKRIRVSNDASADDTGIATLKITYPKQDGTTETKSGVLSSGVANFSDLAFYAPVDKTSVVTVKYDLTSISESGISGDTPQMRVDFNGTFEAVGAGSGSSLDEGSDIHGTGQTTACSDGSGVSTCYADTGTIAGNAMTVRKSKPTVTLHAASPSGAAVPGLNEVLRFTVTADAVSDVVLDIITFKVTTTDNGNTDWNLNGDATGPIDTTSAYSLYDAGDLTTQLESADTDWTLYATDGTTLTGSEEINFASLNFSTDRTIAAGTSKTYVLKVDTTGASSANDDTVRFDVIDEQSTITGNEFQWDEVSSGAASDISGALVKNLPVNGGTLIY